MEANKTKIQQKVRSAQFNYAGLFKEVKMAEIKIILTWLNISGWIFYGWSLLDVSFFSMDAFSRSVIQLLGVVFMVIKIVDIAFSRYRKHRMEMIDIKEKEREAREKEIETYHKETAIIRNFNEMK